MKSKFYIALMVEICTPSSLGTEQSSSTEFSVDAKNGGAVPPLPHTSSWPRNKSLLYLEIACYIFEFAAYS